MKRNKAITWVIVLVTVLAMVGFSGLFNLGSGNPAPHTNQQTESNQNNRAVPCLTSEAFHIHPKLKILVDGKEEVLPGGIGILPGCTREIHTHEADGIIHIEAAVDRGYTFADLLSVWGKPLIRDGYALKMTVGGKEAAEPNFVMKDGQQIVLEYTGI